MAAPGPAGVEGQDQRHRRRRGDTTLPSPRVQGPDAAVYPKRSEPFLANPMRIFTPLERAVVTSYGGCESGSVVYEHV